MIEAMSLRQQTKCLLQTHNLFPKKRLGQHFMIDRSLLKRMVCFGDINKEDMVLEIGAGLGFLTELLSKRCKRVFAVEVDPKLVKVLHERFDDVQNIELIEGDILKVSVPPFNKVISTPPYFISSHLLFWLLNKSFDSAVLTFQKEFAERLASSVGRNNYGRLTVTTYYHSDVKLLDYVPRTAFYPTPEVDSMVVWLKPKLTPPFKVKDEQDFFQLVQMAFAKRNKKIRNAVIPFLEKRGITRKEAREFADSLTFHDKRARELAPEDFGVLTNEIREKTSLL